METTLSTQFHRDAIGSVSSCLLNSTRLKPANQAVSQRTRDDIVLPQPVFVLDVNHTRRLLKYLVGKMNL